MKQCSVCLTVVALLLGTVTAGADEPDSYQDPTVVDSSTATDAAVADSSLDAGDSSVTEGSPGPADDALESSADADVQDDGTVTGNEETMSIAEPEMNQERVSGDTLSVPPATSTTARTHVVQTPHRGMNMLQVEKKFGTPVKKLPAVGKPPISRWVYGDYTVYFEGQYVIHSVLNGS